MRECGKRTESALRTVFFLFALLIASPIRSWPLSSGVDETWRFALNYAHAAKIETLFTSGRLGWMVFPQNIGNNLSTALTGQFVVWLVLGAVFFHLFFRAGIRLSNLAVFTFCFSLAAPLFWFDFLGLENSLLAAALILLVLFRFRGSHLRHAAAIFIISALPLFKLTAGLVGFSALAGLLADSMIRRYQVFRTTLLTVAIPPVVLAAAWFCLMPRGTELPAYAKANAQLVAGFTSAMSQWGRGGDLVSAFLALVTLAALVWICSRRNFETARFYALLLTLALVISFKHGFVRQDPSHVANLFCFVSLCWALVSLTATLEGAELRLARGCLLVFAGTWCYSVASADLRGVFSEVTGIRSAALIAATLHSSHDPEQLRLPADQQIEPELLAAIGNSPVASLSVEYVNLAAAHANIVLYPVVQRYAVYTPYLDSAHAEWVRTRGPRYLVFDGHSIDSRDAWAETPAMWLEIYRWYDTRLLGPRNLLLERRATPRFASLQSISKFQMTFPGELQFPASSGEIFWTLHCDYNLRGALMQALFRNPAVYASVAESGRAARVARVIPQLLISPVMGTYLPGNLADFAALFRDREPGYSVSSIRFERAGTVAYKPYCQAELLQPVK